MLLKYIFFAADVILLNAALLLGAYAGDSTAQDTAYLLIYSNLAWLFLGLVSGVYQITRQWAPARILRHQIAFLLIHLLAVLALIHFLNKHYSPLQLAVSYLVFALLYLGYKAAFYYFRNAIRKSKRLRNFIIVGRNDLAYTLRKYYIQHPELGYCFKGFRDIDSIESIGQFCVENEVKEIQCCAPLTEKQAQELVAFGLNRLVKVKIVYENPATAEVSKSKLIDIQPAREQALVPLDRPINRIVKRSFDLLLTGILFVLVLWWFIPLVGLIIKLDSKGPMLFIQPRNGEGNKPFGCYKFRTMTATETIEATKAEKNDPRITRVGFFLRRSSIDEIPQLINVLLGQMSLIGPRPHAVKHNQDFGKMLADTPFGQNIIARHYIKPGITGLAQCMGYRGSITSVEDIANRVNLDRYYIERWTFWLDIKIVFLTVVSLVRGNENAY